METRHGEGHERIVRGVLTGDLDAEDADIAELLRSCETCRNELSDLRELVSHLDRAAAREKETLRAAKALEAAPGAELVEPVLRDLLPEDARPAQVRPAIAGVAPRLRRGPVLAGALAAAALVLAALQLPGLLAPAGEPPAREELMMGAAIEVLEPRAPRESLVSFRWRPALTPGGWYVVRVWAANEDNGVLPRVTSPQLRDPEWTPEPDDLERIPQRFRWVVTSYTVGEEVHREGGGEGTRSEH